MKSMAKRRAMAHLWAQRSRFRAGADPVLCDGEDIFVASGIDEEDEDIVGVAESERSVVGGVMLRNCIWLDQSVGVFCEDNRNNQPYIPRLL